MDVVKNRQRVWNCVALIPNKERATDTAFMHVFSHYRSFLGSLAKLLPKGTISFAMLSFRPYAWKNLASTRPIFVKINVVDFH
jgi:hypothetical protein